MRPPEIDIRHELLGDPEKPNDLGTREGHEAARAQMTAHQEKRDNDQLAM